MAAPERRVLVVDDEALIRETLEAALEDEGYVVRSAPNGEEALRVLAVWRPDVILLDLMMPVLDGWAFRDAQRDRVDLAAIPVIILSGARNVRASAQQLNADAAIAKPFELDEVLSTVARLAASG